MGGRDRMIKAAIGLIFFLTSINIYLISMISGFVPFVHVKIDFYLMRTWFSGSVVILVFFIVWSLLSDIKEKEKEKEKEKGQFESIIIGLLSLAAAQLVVFLNGVHLTDSPYALLGVFNACNILAYFTTHNYLSLNHYGTNDAGD